MAKPNTMVHLELDAEDRRSAGIWIILLILGFFVSIVSWFEWGF